MPPANSKSRKKCVPENTKRRGTNDPLPGDDKLKGKFSTQNTTVLREIVDEKMPLVIDLAMP
jgi:hypothetical protein